MESFERAHICGGESLIRGFGEADLKDNPALWAELWEAHRDALLPECIERNPGRRCAAWWRFDAPEPLDEDEPEVEYLHRHGLMSPDEVSAIIASAKRLAQYNVGRSGADIRSNYIPPDDAQEWAASQGFLTDEETAILSEQNWYNPECVLAGSNALEPDERRL